MKRNKFLLACIFSFLFSSSVFAQYEACCLLGMLFAPKPEEQKELKEAPYDIGVGVHYTSFLVMPVSGGLSVRYWFPDNIVPKGIGINVSILPVKFEDVSVFSCDVAGLWRTTRRAQIIPYFGARGSFTHYSTSTDNSSANWGGVSLLSGFELKRGGLTLTPEVGLFFGRIAASDGDGGGSEGVIGLMLGCGGYWYF